MGSLFQNITGRKVTLIEDEVDVCLVLKAYLMRKECKVQICHTIQTAFREMGDFAPEIVVVNPDYYDDRKVLIQKILTVSPSVVLIVSGRYMIYSNADFL